MYYDHFGLSEPPFRITPNTGFFFGGGRRGAILEALIYAVTQGEGMVKVTGEVGSGKTMLCNMLQARLPPNIETVYLAHPNVAPEEILHAIAFELQIGTPPVASRLQVMHALQAHLLQRHAEGRRVVVIVEESQGMPLATLEEIRLLSNLETRDDKLLQIVLFGQPELDENLRQPAIRQLRDRIVHGFRLEPLDAEAIHEYLMFRMRTAGYRGPDLFPRAVVKHIARASEGLTRRVNLIADKALLAAFAENAHTIRPKHVEAAVRDSEFSRGARPRVPRPALAWSALVLTVIVTGTAIHAWTHVGKAHSPTTEGGAAVPAPGTAPGARAAHEADMRPGPAAAAPAVAAADRSSPVPEPVPPAGIPVGAAAHATADRPQARSLPPTPVKSLVEQRLAATRQWLAVVNPNAFTIQLMEAGHEPQLAHDLSQLSKLIEMNQVFLYRIGANHNATLSVLYGSFNDRGAAQDALDSLPPALKANRPFLRTWRGVRNAVW
jgi:type II secretory pathway predicted ATPase ExeA/septal ring-binding cell division protein DamX